MHKFTLYSAFKGQSLHLEFQPGFYVVKGGHGAGKTTVLAALSYLCGSLSDLSGDRKESAVGAPDDLKTTTYLPPNALDRPKDWLAILRKLRGQSRMGHRLAALVRGEPKLFEASMPGSSRARAAIQLEKEPTLTAEELASVRAIRTRLGTLPPEPADKAAIQALDSTCYDLAFKANTLLNALNVRVKGRLSHVPRWKKDGPSLAQDPTVLCSGVERFIADIALALACAAYWSHDSILTGEDIGLTDKGILNIEYLYTLAEVPCILAVSQAQDEALTITSKLWRGRTRKP